MFSRPYVTTGILKALPKIFISPVPVFLKRVGRVFLTSIIDNDMALTKVEV